MDMKDPTSLLNREDPDSAAGQILTFRISDFPGVEGKAESFAYTIKAPRVASSKKDTA